VKTCPLQEVGKFVSGYADSVRGSLIAGKGDLVVSAEGIACKSCSCMLDFSEMSKREEVVRE
jgi:hypothetical protein